MSGADLYREHRVFRRSAHGVVVYVCFERLGDGRFIVQQVEFIHGKSAAEYLTEADQIAAQTLELFAEGKASDGRQWSLSLAEAVALHDSEFGN